jgi:hypothetical protein
MIGGVYRLKYHLVKIPSHNVGPYSNVSPEIMRLAHDSINSKERKKEEAAPKRAEFATFKATQGSGISASATKGSGRGSTATDNVARAWERSGSGSGSGSGSVGVHFSKNGQERSVSGAFIYIYIQKKPCRMPN